MARVGDIYQMGDWAAITFLAGKLEGVAVGLFRTEPTHALGTHYVLVYDARDTAGDAILHQLPITYEAGARAVFATLEKELRAQC